MGRTLNKVPHEHVRGIRERTLSLALKQGYCPLVRTCTKGQGRGASVLLRSWRGPRRPYVAQQSLQIDLRRFGAVAIGQSRARVPGFPAEMLANFVGQETTARRVHVPISVCPLLVHIEPLRQ